MRVLISVVLITLCIASIAVAEGFSYNDHNKRDPFWRLVTSSGVILNYDQDLMISDMNLEGIIYDPHGRSLAVINGNVVKPGDKIGLFIVQNVLKTKVILTKGQKRYVLELKKEE